METNLQVKVLDRGFVRLRNLAGPTRRPLCAVDSSYGPGTDRGLARAFDADDVDVAQAARMSFEQMDTERTYAQDMKLADYLLRNRHTSPFEMIQVWVEVKVPIFVDRQLVRHRTWRRNESSGRYIVLPSEWYVPEKKDVGGVAENKKQGRADILVDDDKRKACNIIEKASADAYDAYQELRALGVANEQARMVLPLNMYVHWVGNVDLSNLFHFLSLRTHSHAQGEAQAYARAIVGLLKPHIPGLMDLFDRYCTETPPT